MTKAGYNNIDFSLKHRNGIAHEQYGYNIGQITAFKDDEKYIVGFALTTPSNIPENNGNLLLKSLSTIISNVDISDLDNRNLMIKSALELDNNTLLNENSCFSIENDVLSIRVQVCSLEVSLQFYTSKVKRQSLPLNFDNMEGHEFEFFCANLLKNNGYEKINVTRGSGDQGIDIIAYRDGIKYGIQCKCYNSDIGNKAVQEVFAGKTFYECHIGVVLTNQYFTKSATELAKKNGIILWDRNKLISMVEMANSKCD
ncbi:MAG: restriction endonuclease [Clostridia bacterium]|nr:restriction endonuclease [Clostridia bacterium]